MDLVKRFYNNVLKLTMNNAMTIVIFIHVVMLISRLLYNRYRCTNLDYKDPMLIPLNVGDLNGYSLIYVFIYIVLGYILPSQFYTAITASVILESLVFLHSYYDPGFLHYFIKCNGAQKQDTSHLLQGKLYIVLLSIVGFGIGYYISMWEMKKGLFT
jgi:hypothetical protein